MEPQTLVYLIIGAVSLLAYFLFFKNTGSKPCLSKTDAKKFPLLRKTAVSHNTAIYRFALPKKDDVLGLPIGQHISITAEIQGRAISRSYTPITNDTHKGHFDLLIKTYPEGNISKVVQDLAIGDKISVKGPRGGFTYTPNMCTHLTMIAGGTGITPMYQIIENIVNNPDDKTHVRFIYANVSEEDILMRKELDAMVCQQFQVYYVLNNASKTWQGGVGFVTQHIISDQGYVYEQGRKVLMCGPPPMNKAVVTALEELGYPKANVISKMEDAIFKF